MNVAHDEVRFENLNCLDIIRQFFLYSFFLSVLLKNLKSNAEFVHQSFEVLGWERQFKNIFDNLEEPVVIFSKN